MSRDAYEVNKAARGLEDVSKIGMPPAVNNFVTRTRRYATELGRTYRSQRDMTDVNRAGQEIRIGSRRKGAEAVGRRVFGTEGVRDYVETANRIGARRVGLQAEAAGQDGRSRAARAVRENKARQTGMEDRAVGEAKRLRNVGFGLGAGAGLATAGTVAALHRDNKPVIKAKRINLNDIASLERQTAAAAQEVAAAEKKRAKVHARHDPIVAAAAGPKKRAPRRKDPVPNTVRLNTNPPKQRASRPRQSQQELREGALRINENLRSPASPRQIRRGALIGAGIGATVAGGAALYGIHRAKKKRARLVPVGKGDVSKRRIATYIVPRGPKPTVLEQAVRRSDRKGEWSTVRPYVLGVGGMLAAPPLAIAGGTAAVVHHKRKSKVEKAGARIPKPKVGSVVRTSYGGHSRNATVGRGSNGRRKLTFQTPVTSVRPEGARQTYNLQNFTTGPVWRAGGYAAANPGRTAAYGAGGTAALGTAYWAGTRNR